MSIETMKLALEALEETTRHFSFSRLGESRLADTTVRGKAHEAAKSLRAAIEQAEKPTEQEAIKLAAISTAAIGYFKDGDAIQPEYDTVALRDVTTLYAKYEALCKQAEKQVEYTGNGTAGREADVRPTGFFFQADKKQAEKQEPVAWHEPGAYGNVTVHEKWAKENGWLPLYTAPPQREWQGLTDEEIQDAWIAIMQATKLQKVLPIPDFSRAIEAKLKEKNT